MICQFMQPTREVYRIYIYTILENRNYKQKQDMIMNYSYIRHRGRHNKYTMKVVMMNKLRYKEIWKLLHCMVEVITYQNKFDTIVLYKAC